MDINNYIPPPEVRTAEIGQCYDNLEKSFKGKNLVFNLRSLKTNNLLNTSKGVQKKEFIMSSEFEETSNSQEIGIAAEGTYNTGQVKIAASYQMSLASAEAANRFNVSSVVSNFEVGRIIELRNYTTNREKLLESMNPTIAADLNAIINEKDFGRKFAKYLTFIETYGHGCVIKVFLFSGCMMELSFDMSSSSSASKFEHEAKVGVKSITNSSLNTAGRWAGQQEEEKGFSSYNFSQITIPIGNPLEEWVTEMKAAIDEDIKYYKEKSPKKATIPKEKWKPEFIPIKDFTDEERKAYKENRGKDFVGKANDQIDNGEYFDAYRTLKLADKYDADTKELKATCLKYIDEEFESIKTKAGDGVDIEENDEFSAFLENYKSLDPTRKTATANLLDDNTDIQSIEGLIEDGEIRAAYELCVEMLEKYPDSNYLDLQKSLAVDEADGKFDTIKGIADDPEAEISAQQKLDYLSFLEFYLEIKPDKQEEINRVKTLIEDKQTNGIVQNEKAMSRSRKQKKQKVEENDNLSNKYLKKQKKQDGCAHLTIEEYLALLKKERENFTLEKVVDIITKIEKEAHQYFSSYRFEKQADAKIIKDDDPIVEQDYYTYHFELATWDELLPNYFEINFSKTLTGLQIGKLMFFVQSRIKFLQYLSFFSREDALYDNMYSSYKKIFAQDVKVLKSVLTNKNTPFTQGDFNNFIAERYIVMVNNEIISLKETYDTFFSYFNYFLATKNGYTIKISDEKGEHFLEVSDYLIHDHNQNEISNVKWEYPEKFSDNLRIFPKIQVKDSTVSLDSVVYLNNAFSTVVVVGMLPPSSSIYEWQLKSFKLPVISEEMLKKPIITQNDVTCKNWFIDEEGDSIPEDDSKLSYTLERVGDGKITGYKEIVGFPLFK